MDTVEFEEESNQSAITDLGGGTATDGEYSKLILKERTVNIPYILNGELYEIQTQEGENVTVKCCNCPPDRVYRGSVRSTGNFHMHIKRRHPDLLGKLHDMKVIALLERRDRLMKNRKISQRALKSCSSSINSNNSNAANSTSSSSSIANDTNNSDTNIKENNVKLESQNQAVDVEQQPLGLMHTHKLKIKTAFQRHQQQKAMRTQWNDSPFNTSPNATSYEEMTPINYSLKENEHTVDTIPESNNERESEKIDDDIRNEKSLQNNDSTQAKALQSTDRNDNGDVPILMYAHQQQHVSTSRAQQPFQLLSSPLLDFNGIDQQCHTPTTPSSISNIFADNSNYFNLSQMIVKNEQLTPANEDRAIDLTVPSGLTLSGNTNFLSNAPSYNDLNNNTNNSASASMNGRTNIKWEQLLAHVETSLRDIQREMRTRNQIETNRMFLDIAKYKYMYPGFNFNY